MFADLRAAYVAEQERTHPANRPSYPSHRVWASRLKEYTSAIDEVYAVVDGREVRVAVVRDADNFHPTGDLGWGQCDRVEDLLDAADRAGYWERPHEVHLDLSPRPVSHGEVARAVLVGQEYVERGLTKVGYDDEMFDATRR
jgi:hypothetical protein